jgi:hypothetical protein
MSCLFKLWKRGKKTSTQRQPCSLLFCASSKGTSLDEGAFVVECWLWEERRWRVCTYFSANDLAWQGALSECPSAGAGAAVMGGGTMTERTAEIQGRTKDHHEK